MESKAGFFSRLRSNGLSWAGNMRVFLNFNTSTLGSKKYQTGTAKLIIFDLVVSC